MSSDDGDIWCSDSEDNSKLEESLETRKLREVHKKRGYVDGISSAKEENLQAGFDSTFSIGSKLGLRVGNLVGRFQVLRTLYGDADSDLVEDARLVENELRINKVLASRHFNEDLDPLASLEELVGKWESRLTVYENKY